MARPSHKLEGRLEILEKAAVAIAAQGYHGMSMRALAAALGKSLAGFYNYYRSKEELLFDLQLRAFESLVQSAEQVTADIVDPGERLYAFMLQHLRYVASHHAVMQVLVQEASTLAPGRRRPIRAAKERYFELGRAVVAGAMQAERCVPGKRAPAVDPSELDRQTYAVFGMLNWTYGWYHADEHGTPEQLARSFQRLALCGLRPECPRAADVAGVERVLRDRPSPPLLQLVKPAPRPARRKATP